MASYISQTSFSSSPKFNTEESALEVWLPAVCLTPFGKPVVPDVYIIVIVRFGSQISSNFKLLVSSLFFNFENDNGRTVDSATRFSNSSATMTAEASESSHLPFNFFFRQSTIQHDNFKSSKHTRMNDKYHLYHWMARVMQCDRLHLNRSLLIFVQASSISLFQLVYKVQLFYPLNTITRFIRR